MSLPISTGLVATKGLELLAFGTPNSKFLEMLIPGSMLFLKSLLFSRTLVLSRSMSFSRPMMFPRSTFS